GAKLFGKLTNAYAPDSQTGKKFQLGIVMDNRLISAPQINERISESGVITGNFTDEETEFLVNVLQAGRLPAVLKKEPISENSISPLLGMDTIRKGATAISISLVAVLSFMAIYYRFSGLIACAALLLNLLLTVGTMILINGAFTLPGLAGLVLTVGISVDNNVLIFERMREELKRGAALRMAIRNGFGRATTTIVDANVTSIITAAVLYYVGNDQIKGFAVTMLLGIVMSMFTAVFCARVVYDIAERKRWITNLNMMQFIGDSHYNFIGLVRPAVTASLVLIGIGLIAVLIRGRQLFDIDFNGGSSVTAMLTQPMTAEEVRAKTSEFDQHATVTEVRTEGRDIRTVWRIDTEDKDVVDLQKKLSATFTDAGTKKSLLVARNFSFDPPVAVAGSEATSNAATAGGASTTNANGAAGEVNATDFNDGSGRGTSLESSGNPADVIPADGDQSLWTRPPASPGNRGGVLLAQADTTLRLAQADTATDVTASSDAEASDAGNAQPAAVPSTNEVVTPTSETTASDLDTGGSAPVTPRQGVEYQSKSVLKFANEPISKRALLDGIVDAAGRINVNVPSLQFSNPKWTGRDENETFSEWTVSFTTTPEQTEKILSELKSEMDSTPAWLSSNRIGAKVASDMREMAVAAIVFCLIGIVLYIWVRFQRVAFGLAAVVALIHDVLIALGGVALSLWLAKVFGFLLVDEFKISLPVVAAFLTLIGYSLNDTIVVFDRIREVRGKSPDLTPQMINDSVNQTLSRTLLTSGTTMIVIIILYIGGGQGIHSFAFSLLIGLIVGTYSSIFIASPVLLWLMKRTMASAGAKKKVTVSR
ncbi:MAG: protein translocase subunit SecD, partial [Planctomycetales bacterium]|nr:protein translocase subunit SecD [Planctomycetales bacterium]